MKLMNNISKSAVRLLLLTFLVGFFPNQGQADVEIQMDISDADLILALSSPDSVKSENATKEVFKRGERMIPLLISCRGNQRPYSGLKLGHPMSANVILLPGKDVPKEKVVTVEVAAMYLLEAIFRQNLQFAQTPYLVDRTLSEENQYAHNSQLLINRAWVSITQWMEQFRKNGLNYLREKRTNPLFFERVSFWGTDPMPVGDGPAEVTE